MRQECGVQRAPAGNSDLAHCRPQHFAWGPGEVCIITIHCDGNSESGYLNLRCKVLQGSWIARLLMLVSRSDWLWAQAVHDRLEHLSVSA